MMEKLIGVILSFLAVAALIIIFAYRLTSFFERVHKTKELKLLKQAGYDADAASLFLERIGADSNDLIRSVGLQKQYKAFKEGVITDFIRKAEAKKKSDDKEADALANGILLGIAINGGGNK